MKLIPRSPRDPDAVDVVDYEPPLDILILDGLDAQVGDARLVGGKAAGLSMSIRAGMPVPRFMVVVPAAGGSGTLSERCRQALTARLATLGSGPFAVRSSARAEDGAADSHAGQFLSLLNVTAADVPDAVQRVMDSGGSPALDAYRAARGRGLDKAEQPCVIIQVMVQARVAGVAFSANPVTGRRDHLVVSATRGLADALVSGEVNGETWTFATPAMDLLGLSRGDDDVLTRAEAEAVAGLCMRAAQTRGCAQDIEWAMTHGEPILLQSRPITTPLLPEAVAETRLLVLDNSNIVESYPGVTSPLTTSFAMTAYTRVYRSFLSMVGVPAATVDAHTPVMANMLSRVDGRIYYNLGNWYRFLSLLPFFASNRAHMEAMMGVSNPLPAEAMTSMPTPPGIGGKVRMVYGLLLAALRLKTTRQAFMARVEDAIPPGATQAALDAMPPSMLAQEYRRVEVLLLDRWDAPIANDFLAMMSFGASRKLMERWCGARGVALHGDLMVGQGGIISAEPARLIREMGALASGMPEAVEALHREDADALLRMPVLGGQLQAYLHRFGDRRIGELKLEQPTLGEAPGPLLSAISASLVTRPDAAVREDPRLALRDAFRGKPLKHWFAGLLLGYAMARVRDRENLRFERTRIFGHARRVFRAMGLGLAASGLIAERDDVFMLKLDELMGLVEGAGVLDDVRGTVDRRRMEYIQSQRRPEPPERILCRGSVADPRNHFYQENDRPVSEQGDPAIRQGIPCGGGVHEGIVRVIRDPATEQVQSGEVMVARTTDPGWISHFAHAGAVVVERGSVLSHSAIVSRELGIACVVAVPDACNWLSTGDHVRVDGSTGRVEKVS